MTDQLKGKYKILKEIGQGGFSRVYLGESVKDQKKVAIKIISKTNDLCEMKDIQKEIKIQKQFESPYIVTFYDMYETKKEIVIVMEYVNGGELFDHIVQKGSFTEQEAANIIQQVLIGLKVLHEKKVIHRDLKPENLLLSIDEKGNTTVKIADFGLSGLIDNSEDMKRFCGTEGYAAPEIMKNVPYDWSVDVWSLGVIVYNLVSGYKPFDSDDDYDLYEQVIAADYEFFSPEFDCISDECKDFISHMLQAKAKDRYTVEMLLEHPWIKGNAPKVEIPDLQSHLREFNAKRKLRKALLAAKTAVKFAAFAGED